MEKLQIQELVIEALASLTKFDREGWAEKQHIEFLRLIIENVSPDIHIAGFCQDENPWFICHTYSADTSPYSDLLDQITKALTPIYGDSVKITVSSTSDILQYLKIGMGQYWVLLSKVR